MPNIEKKNILHIFYSFDMGGAQNRLVSYMNRYGDKYDHYVFAINGCYDLLKTWDNDIPRPKLSNIIYKKGNILRNIRSFRKAIKNYDLIITQNWPSIEAVIANTPQIKPHIHNEDGFGIDEATNLKIKRNIIRRIFLSGKSVVVPSITLKKIANKYWKGFKTKIHHINNGVLPFPHPPLSIKDNIVKLITISMIRPEKNLKLMIDIMRYLVHNEKLNVQWTLIGDGSQKVDLEEYAKKNNVSKNIKFKGFQSDYKQDLIQSDIFVLCSHTEQQPLSLLEACSLEKAIFAPPVGDILQMISDDNKPYINKEYFSFPYSGLVEMIKNKELRINIGKSNRVWQKQFYDLEESLYSRHKVIEYIIDSNKL